MIPRGGPTRSAARRHVQTWDDNTVVTIDDDYHPTSTVSIEPCPQ
jgi:hypothetical protein